MVKTITQSKVQYESNNIRFQKLNFVYFCDLGAVTCFFVVVVVWVFWGFVFIRRLKGRCMIYGLEAKYYIILWKEQTMQKYTSLAL